MHQIKSLAHITPVYTNIVFNKKKKCAQCRPIHFSMLIGALKKSNGTKRNQGAFRIE